MTVSQVASPDDGICDGILLVITAVELCLRFVSYYKVFFNENFLAALTLPGEVDVFGNEYPEFEWVDFEPEE